MLIISGVYLYNVGAGKTTTFSILTGDSALTSGTAIVAGYDIRTNFRDVSAKWYANVMYFVCKKIKGNIHWRAWFIWVEHRNSGEIIVRENSLCAYLNISWSKANVLKKL